ncbi:efflux RND transporter periplasmic adaptor subunit [Telmatobacter bradus]|uniref:efflux RND transporter periplasmic adaptor subunit n=1 Tax=Telmatobacter bradus TaxID=474953 RepID=UPI003B43A44F
MSQENHTQPHNSPETAPAQASLSPRKAVVGMGLLMTAAIVAAGMGIVRQLHEQTVLAERTHALAAPTVEVALPKAGAPVSTFTLPGNVTSFTDSPIYARSSGYLTRWYYDIGAQVKKGALLAIISSPEVDQQLAQAEADLATAQANARNAHIQADRYSGLVKSNAVSKQDTDTFVNQASATAAGVRSAQANVDRLHQLQAFEKVYAPFSGVITARTVDVGQLIDSGAGKELFHLQAIQTLRVYANLPQAYAGSAKRGVKINLSFPEHAGKIYQGTLVRTADAIDPTSRTLLVEIDVDNKSGELLPGSLAQVQFNAPSAGPVFVVPSPAVLFRHEGTTVGVVENGKARLAQVVIGEDDGSSVQVISGLAAGDKVIQDPPDSLFNGEAVSIVQPSANPAGGR